MTVQRGTENLTVHTESETGHIWFGTGDSRACRWDKQPKKAASSRFAEESWVRDASTVRVLGTAANAQLIVDLYNQRLKSKEPQSIKICSPKPSDDPKDIPAVFRGMMENELPASVGGCHEASEADYRIYAVIASFRRSGRLLTDSVKQFLQVHPAYPALSFLPKVNWESAIRFLEQLVDPRFHIHRANPDRNSQLKSFFGLRRENGAANVQAFLSGSSKTRAVRYSYAELVLRTWASSLVPMVADRENNDGPEHFLVRIVREEMVKCEHDAHIRGVLKASHVFLRFVKGVWLDNLTPSREYIKISGPWVLSPCETYSPTLFVPEYFFRNDDEVDAWHAHNQRLNC